LNIGRSAEVPLRERGLSGSWAARRKILDAEGDAHYICEEQLAWKTKEGAEYYGTEQEQAETSPDEVAAEAEGS